MTITSVRSAPDAAPLEQPIRTTASTAIENVRSPITITALSAGRRSALLCRSHGNQHGVVPGDVQPVADLHFGERFLVRYSPAVGPPVGSLHRDRRHRGVDGHDGGGDGPLRRGRAAGLLTGGRRDGRGIGLGGGFAGRLQPYDEAAVVPHGDLVTE